MMGWKEFGRKLSWHVRRSEEDHESPQNIKCPGFTKPRNSGKKLPTFVLLHIG
jgi:hypothetical protein